MLPEPLRAEAEVQKEHHLFIPARAGNGRESGAENREDSAEAEARIPGKGILKCCPVFRHFSPILGVEIAAWMKDNE